MNKHNKIFNFVPRLLAFAATVAAVALMVTSRDSATISTLTFHVKYTDTPAFKYFVIAQGIAGAYSLVALLRSSKNLFHGLVIILDVEFYLSWIFLVIFHWNKKNYIMLLLVVAMLLSSSVSAAFTIADVGRKGNSHAGWLPICEQVPKFCHRVNLSLISGFAATVLYSALLLYSLYIVLDPLKM